MSSVTHPAEAMVNERVAVRLIIGNPAKSRPYPTMIPNKPSPIKVLKTVLAGEVL